MRIEWSEPAVLDLEGIKEFIERDSEYYAIEFTGRIIEMVEKLSDFPNLGRKVPEVEDEKIREIVFHNYRLIYKLSDESILVLAIIHAARDLNNMKQQPWENT
ncbi:type II toxin-antitoxin system RelE/ParE family toxin [Desulfosporosinus sp. OT]|uniref:type II toxin-antitoxin system RelE/ParE family toxin n=1 Tax=Desulfosporosinus sp. OT TaxID=913865 RepID=UPI000223A162|nr:type II toxin-antitoxin system RelE/ParE family toxin [Desulfosporosinus sp. OT]EGW39310.1 plasmid stabilization system family protein [Desulfosporosinus sp. OT]